MPQICIYLSIYHDCATIKTQSLWFITYKAKQLNITKIWPQILLCVSVIFLKFVAGWCNPECYAKKLQIMCWKKEDILDILYQYFICVLVCCVRFQWSEDLLRWKTSLTERKNKKDRKKKIQYMTVIFPQGLLIPYWSWYLYMWHFTISYNIWAAFFLFKYV